MLSKSSDLFGVASVEKELREGTLFREATNKFFLRIFELGSGATYVKVSRDGVVMVCDGGDGHDGDGVIVIIPTTHMTSDVRV